MKYGADGYALYWLCIELIAAPIDKQNLSFELEHDVEILAFRLKIDSARCEEIMRFFVAQKLFEMDATTQKITCLKLASRLEYSVVKNPHLKRIQDGLKGEKLANIAAKSGTIPDNHRQVVPEEIRLDKKQIDTSEPTVADDSRITKKHHEAVIEIYHDSLPELSKVMVSRWHGSKHAKNLGARWREDSRFRTRDFWTAFFQTVRENPWWMGEPDAKSGASWDGCNLAWLVKRENFDKVIDRGMGGRS